MNRLETFFHLTFPNGRNLSLTTVNNKFLSSSMKADIIFGLNQITFIFEK